MAPCRPQFQQIASDRLVMLLKSPNLETEFADNAAPNGGFGDWIIMLQHL